MKKWRKKMFPKQPQTIQEMGDILRDPNNQKLLEHSEGSLKTVVITDEDQCKHFILYDQNLIDKNYNCINNIRAWIDATYETTMKLNDAYQSLNIMLSKYDHAFQVINVTMSRKTEKAYRAVMNYITSNIIKADNVKVVMTDFEEGLRNACRAAFPHARLAACLVHYERAVIKKLCKEFRLGAVIENNHEAAIFVKKILALPCLPSEIFEENYYILKNNLSAGLKSSFRGFFLYFERQWLRRQPFSVFGLPNRTNNEIESLNSILLDVLGSHPYPWSYLAGIQKLTSKHRTDLLSLQRGKRISRQPRALTKRRKKAFITNWQKLWNHAISPQEFLDVIIDFIGKPLEAPSSEPDHQIVQDDPDLFESRREDDPDFERDVYEEDLNMEFENEGDEVENETVDQIGGIPENDDFDIEESNFYDPITNDPILNELDQSEEEGEEEVTMTGVSTFADNSSTPPELILRPGTSVQASSSSTLMEIQKSQAP